MKADHRYASRVVSDEYNEAAKRLYVTMSVYFKDPDDERGQALIGAARDLVKVVEAEHEPDLTAIQIVERLKDIVREVYVQTSVAVTA